MTQPRRILWFTFSAIALLLLPNGAAAQNYVTPVVKPTPPGQLIVVNNGPGSHTDPHVHGDLVSYTDQQNNTAITVRYFNLTTHTDAMVPPGYGSLDFLSDVRGTTIVFTRSGSSSPIFAFDIAAGGQPVEIAPQPGSFRSGAQIGDQTIVWQDFATSSSSSSIVAYDRTTGATTVVSASPPELNQNPGISPDGNTVVWEGDCANVTGPCSIWKAIRSSAGTWNSQQLVSQAGGQSHPDTDGTIIAYSSAPPDGIGGTGHLAWQPVAGGTEQVLNLPGSAIDASVSGRLIAFAYDSTGAGVYQVAVYDTAANVLYNVTGDVLPTGNRRTLNDISVTPDGKVRVVWQVYENDFHLYAYTFNLPVADLAIQKFGFPNTVHVGQDIAYGLLVHNLGPNTANDVLVTDSLPANTVLVGARPSQGSCTGPAAGSGGTVTCNLGNIVKRGYAIVGIAVKVTGGAGTTITNTATVGASNFDPNPSNNSASVSTTVSASSRED